MTRDLGHCGPGSGPNDHRDEEQVLDRRGRTVTIRDVTPLDTGKVEDLLRHLSRRSARQRFLCSSSTVETCYAKVLTDRQHTLDAVVATAGTAILGVGSNHQMGEGSGVGEDCCEFALTVDEDDQGQGIGTLLLESLVDRAQRHGYRTLVGTVMQENVHMFDVVTHLGLPWKAEADAGVAVVRIDLGEHPAYANARLARKATAHSVKSATR